MGDRTYCTLTVWKDTTINEFEGLMNLLHDNLGEPCDRFGVNELQFEEINYAGITDPVEEYLRKHGFSYDWSWEPGGDYPGGCDLYDADSKESYSFCLADSEPVLRLTDAMDEEKRNAANKWAKWMRHKRPFSILDSPSDEYSLKIGTKEADHA